jgi:hypothetical protein
MTGSSSGLVSVRAVNTCGEGDSISVQVTVRPEPNPVVTATGNTLSTGTYAGYQWLFNEVAIPGAQSQSYVATNSGGYRVRVVDANGCVDTSSVHNHTVLGIGDVELEQASLLFPNPASSVLYIKTPYKVDVAVYSMDGKLVLKHKNTTQIDISKLPAGMYQVKLNDQKGTLRKIEKLIVIRN